MNFLVSPSDKENRDHTRQKERDKKYLRPRQESYPRTPYLINRCYADGATSEVTDGGNKSWQTMVRVIAVM